MTAAVAGPETGTVAGAAEPVASPRLGRRLLRRPIAIACIVYLVLLVAIAIVAPIALPDVAGERAGDLLAARQGPSAEHPLGTDSLGRDVLERLLVGTRVTLLGVVEALLVGLALGVPFGIMAGFFGGRLDRTVGWLADLTFSVPTVIVIIIVLAVFPQSMLAAMCALGLLVAPGIMRVIRSATLPVKEELYIAAARVAGLSQAYIVTRHVLPRVIGPIIVQASLLAAAALLVQSGLAFLNLVVAPPAPSWGGLVADGASTLEEQPWLIWPPGVAIALTVLAFGLLGDAVGDATTEKWSSRVRRGRTPRRRAPEPAPAEPDGNRDAALLSVRHLSVSLAQDSGPVRLLEDVSIDIGPGETVGVVGESGCGKTITATAILGLLPAGARIEHGEIRFGGRDLATLPEGRLRAVRGREIALISQEPMISLDPSFRVGAQLVEALRTHHAVSRRDARARTIELLSRVRLPDPEAVARRYPRELSGGMAQRVAIARALTGEPKLLIADEPTTALDVTVQAEILRLLRDIQQERGMAILLVTHDWGVVADMCDRAVVMYAGHVVERAELVPMFRRPLHPYTEALLASNPGNAVDGERLPTIAGVVPQPGMWPAGCHFHPRCAYATAECTHGSIPVHRPGADRATRCIHHERVGGAGAG